MRPTAGKKRGLSKNLNKKATFAKYQRLVEILKSFDGLLVAFSGGVDSSLLLKAAADSGAKVLAVTVDSPIYHRQEIREARQIASKLGVPFRLIKSDDYLREDFKKNDLLRCYHCKLAIFTRLREIARSEGLSAVVEGSNLDDERDYRPGRKALAELGIGSPLKEAGLGKAEIRFLARSFGLPNWDRPANACLATRIPYGQPVELRWLERIAAGETFLRKMGFSQVRLRHHGELARIEVWPNELALVISQPSREKIVRRLKKLGWKYVAFDLEGYRTGSLNPGGLKT
ncbi:MAG: ATP-utilizing enzyme of the PP-loop superfamily [Candidatus Saccharicenans subterraneus]|uniref:ATP-utilizing enzyme of the PP-loop superfamily n=1 Tax=Candidatus Saccharicenans subterraneus TaxID=2508984 RepID=A0A3E2BLC6_9BACT|nr:MAG: ATP-utilizing enzyme of the PP-loop superfamily [Candidatus Saccharicenans subterraneum]